MTGTRFALTPPISPGEINRVSMYRKAVKTGKRLLFEKFVVLIMVKLPT